LVDLHEISITDAINLYQFRYLQLLRANQFYQKKRKGTMFCIWIEAYLKNRKGLAWNQSFHNTDQYSTILGHKSTLKKIYQTTIAKTPAAEPSIAKSVMNIQV